VIILDTSGLLAALDASESHHATAARALLEAAPPRLLSPFVLAELDYLLATRISAAVARQLLQEIAGGSYQLEPFTGADVESALVVLEQYSDLGLGLADASLVVLADRHDVLEILTLDERHFRALRGPHGRPFRLLPADAA
jgi:predicted nucleic acid-binding protein